MSSTIDYIVVAATIIAALIPLGALAVSGWRYVSYRKEELQFKRYEQYHQLLSLVSKGSDDKGALKLVNQRAYIYELRHFPEYQSLTMRLLDSLKTDWMVNKDLKEGLLFELNETIAFLRANS